MHDDNTALLACVRSGRNPTMRYLGRTHQAPVAWLKEVCDSGVVNMVYAKSEDMAADVFTNGFSDPERWRHACFMIRVGLPTKDIVALLHSKTPPTLEGGYPNIHNHPKIQVSVKTQRTMGNQVPITAQRLPKVSIRTQR